MMLMQEVSSRLALTSIGPVASRSFSHPSSAIERISRQYIQIAIFYSSTRMLKSFFFGLGIYILWSEKLPCINYGSVIFCLFMGNFFTLSQAPLEVHGLAGVERLYYCLLGGFSPLLQKSWWKLLGNSTPHATHSLNLIIKWSKFTAG
jgi:hypothetical protein